MWEENCNFQSKGDFEVLLLIYLLIVGSGFVKKDFVVVLYNCRREGAIIQLFVKVAIVGGKGWCGSYWWKFVW